MCPSGSFYGNLLFIFQIGRVIVTTYNVNFCQKKTIYFICLRNSNLLEQKCKDGLIMLLKILMFMYVAMSS